MDLAKVLAELREELADLNAAIESLEQLPHARPKARRESLADDARSVSAAAAAAVNGRNRDSA